jgi:N-acetylated-alpha-linked acidic dipeptidase
MTDRNSRRRGRIGALGAVLAAGAALVVSPARPALQPAALDGFAPTAVAAQLACEADYLAKPAPATYREHLRMLTREPHVAGSPGSMRVVEYIGGAMKRAGWSVETFDYDVYLPHQGAVEVALVTPIRLPLNNQEYILTEDPFSADERLRPGWNAYSGSGEAVGQVVYVNYGRREDFVELERLGISVKDRIVIARYGGNFRGYKAKYAEAAGAAGLVIFTDPADGGYMTGLVYPEGRHASESTIQRGSLLTLDYTGDPLTPFEPALPEGAGIDVQRLDPADVPFHTIPVAPLPYGSAVEILRRMEGPPVPASWQGGLPFTYRLTGGAALTVRVFVDQPHRLTRIRNVVGTLSGSDLPDEWVVFGSHHDAWGFGAVDPNSGSAMLLTMADAIGGSSNCRPRRTLKIAHWDAEEFGIIGSTEWVEQHRDELAVKGVAYINADSAVTGPLFGAASSPSLKTLIAEVSRSVQHPDDGVSMHTHWVRQAPGQAQPVFGNLGGGSDHVGFYTHIGMPAAGPGLSGPAPIYHSNYDTFAWFERFGDPQFEYGAALARLDGLLALRLARADVIPYDPARYAADLQEHVAALEVRAGVRGLPVQLDRLRAALPRLADAAGAFGTARGRSLGRPPAAASLAEVNGGLIGLEKAFLRPEGLQFSAWSRSLFASPDPFSGYAPWMLPGLRYEVEEGTGESVAEWEEVYVRAVDDLTQRLRDVAGRMR